MSALLTSLLRIADCCWWLVYHQTPAVSCMRVKVELFLGEPDEMGSYEVTTLTKEYGPKV